MERFQTWLLDGWWWWFSAQVQKWIGSFSARWLFLLVILWASALHYSTEKFLYPSSCPSLQTAWYFKLHLFPAVCFPVRLPLLICVCQQTLTSRCQCKCQIILMLNCLHFLDNRLEELQEKYNQEVEERKRLETELKVMQVKVSKSLIPIMCLFICGKLVMLTLLFSSRCWISHQSV